MSQNPNTMGRSLKIVSLIMVLVIMLATLAACAPAAAPSPTAAPAVPATAAAPGVPTTAPAAPTTAAAPTKGGKIVYCEAASGGTLDPFATPGRNVVQTQLFPSLLARGLNNEIIGCLADSWQASADGKTITMKLHPGMKFSDGTPVDAEAVKWNLTHYIDPATRSPMASAIVGVLTSVEVADSLTVKLQLDHPYAPVFDILVMLGIASPTAYQKWGPDFATHPVGAGPYVFKELVVNSYVALERNPDCTWLPKEVGKNPGPVYPDEFVISFVGEEQTILSGLQTGDFTIAAVASQNVDALKANPNVTVHTLVRGDVSYVLFNCSRAPWSNKELRRALAYAVDRDVIVKNVFGGMAVAAYGPLPAATWGYNEKVKDLVPAYDPPKAKQALDGLGYKDTNGDGVREDPQGKPFQIMLVTPNAATNKATAEVLQSQFGAVGIKVELQVMDAPAARALEAKGDYDVALGDLRGANDPRVMNVFLSPKNKGVTNAAFYDSKEAEALMNKMDADMNPETRLATAKQVQELLVQDLPWIPLTTSKSLIGVRNELKGVIATTQALHFNDAYFGPKQ